nr:transporter substrate-binding domain-containing protein [Rhizobium sp. ARZ01]
MCGKRVGAVKGSATAKIAEELSARCKAEGKPEIAQNVFPYDSSGMVAVRSGRIDAHLLDSVVAGYEATTAKGKAAFRVVLPELQPTKFLYGFVVSKQNPALTEAMAAALGDMVADGSYKAILDKYGAGDSAVTKVTVNAGVKQAQ